MRIRSLRQKTEWSIALALFAVGFLLPVPARAWAAAAAPLPRYDMRLQIDQSSATVHAEQRVRLTNLGGVPIDQVVFHSMAGAQGELTLEAVRVDGEAASPSWDDSGSVLTVPLKSSRPPGAGLEISLTWTLHVSADPDRLSAADGVLALGNWFPTLAVYHGDWDRRPFTTVGDPFFTEASDFDVSIDLTQDAPVAYTGDLVRHQGSHWDLAARSVRDFALAISSDFQEADVQVPGGPVVKGYSPDPDRARTEAEAAKDYVGVYQSLIGPYPYQSLKVVETGLPAIFLGMEYPEIVFVGKGAVQAGGPQIIRDIVAHEVAHQWCYGLIGDDQFADPWLDEAFATYLPIEASEQLPPDRAANSYLAAPGDGPAIDQGVFDFSGNGPYTTAVYSRGARFLAELRATMGDDAWVTFLHSMYQTYRYKVATPRAVLDLAQQAAGVVSLGDLIFTYTGPGDIAPPPSGQWGVEMAPTPLSGNAQFTVHTDFGVSRIELWLDDWRVADGNALSYAVDLSVVPAGDYVLVTRVTDDYGAIYERATRVSVAAQ